MANRLDRLAHGVQDFVGPGVTSLVKRAIGPWGTRFAYHLVGRTARHRIQLDCRKEVVGAGEEAWVVCPDCLLPNGVVYSLGVGKQITFDLDLIEKFDVDVFAFDPTPESIGWAANEDFPAKFHFIGRGISNYDGVARFKHISGIQFGIESSASHDEGGLELQVNRLTTIMKKLNHTKIDLLKMNIEGGEYAVIADLAASNVDVKQIVVEFHHRLPSYSLKQTKQAVRSLAESGYRIFHIADNGKEYSFIRGSQ